MKSRIQQIVFLGTFLLLCASAEVFAQNAGMPDVEIATTTPDHEKTVFTPGEDVPYIPRVTGVRAPTDSIALQMQDFPMQRAAQRPAEKPADKQQAAKKDDSILTYNFLYYIIQKYKLQDIID